jgi:cell division protein FtsL
MIDLLLDVMLIAMVVLIALLPITIFIEYRRWYITHNPIQSIIQKIPGTAWRKS